MMKNENIFIPSFTTLKQYDVHQIIKDVICLSIKENNFISDIE